MSFSLFAFNSTYSSRSLVSRFSGMNSATMTYNALARGQYDTHYIYFYVSCVCVCLCVDCGLCGVWMIFYSSVSSFAFVVFVAVRIHRVQYVYATLSVLNVYMAVYVVNDFWIWMNVAHRQVPFHIRIDSTLFWLTKSKYVQYIRCYCVGCGCGSSGEIFLSLQTFRVFTDIGNYMKMCPHIEYITHSFDIIFCELVTFLLFSMYKSERRGTYRLDAAMVRWVRTKLFNL